VSPGSLPGAGQAAPPERGLGTNLKIRPQRWVNSPFLFEEGPQAYKLMAEHPKRKLCQVLLDTPAGNREYFALDITKGRKAPEDGLG